MKKDNKGFSLVELIVVVAIMAVLMVVATPALLRYVEKTRIQKDDTAVSEVLNATKIACAEEAIYTKVAAESSAVTVVVADDTAITSTVADLQTEVRYSMGEKIKFESKKYAGKTYTITITFNTAAQGFDFAGAWN